MLCNDSQDCYTSYTVTFDKLDAGRTKVLGGGGDHSRKMFYQTDELITGLVVTQGRGG